MGDFTYLTLKDILTYYRETIDQSGGGMFGIREQDGIEKILDFVQNDMYYPTLEDKLTYLVYAFCTGHYFADGNKRISLVITVFSILYALKTGILIVSLTSSERHP